MKRIRMAVIGIGHLGSRHLKVCCELTEQVDLVGICDVKAERTLKLAEHYRVPFFADYRQLAGLVDAVIIAVPTLHHYAVARFFLQHGVHTFIEKPFTTNLPQADELIALAGQNNLRVQVGHVERFNSAFLGIQHFTKNPLFIECHRLNTFPNRSLDIGVVMDLMIHDIDIILGLNQEPVESVHAVGVQVLTPLEDIASARIIFENGCVCNLTASRVSDEVMRKIRIFLTDAYISLDYVKQEAFIYKKHDNIISKHALPIEKEEPLKKEVRSFVECVGEERYPVVGGLEGRAALDLALQIEHSIHQSRQKILTPVA